MPLSPPAERELLHTRAIELHGYRRADGLFDIEARLTDTKSYPFSNHDRGVIEPGIPLHGMLARMTVSEDMVITAFEAATEYGPYAICPSAAPNFARLAGLKIGRGFIKAANERVGGVHGCTHLRELLGQMGTVAFQTLYAVRSKRPPAADAAPNATETAGKPMMLGTCLAYAPDSPVVQRQWPAFYTGPAAE
ncbi:MAG TPA: DUF2889 domain-containing protein [Acetobacteraceae bacterium]